MVSSDHAPEVGDGAPNAPGDADGGRQRPKRSALRLVLWLVAASAGVAALATALVFWLLGHLDHPRVKPRLQALAREHAGLDVDYEALSVFPWEGVRARWIRIAQPAAFRTVAQDFLRIDDLDVRLDARGLIEGGPLEVALVRAGRIEATLVRDASGTTTLSELFPSDPAANEPATPLSRALADLPEVRVAKVALEAIGGRVLDVVGGMPLRTSELRSLSVSGVLRTEPSSLRGTALRLRGSPSLRLEVREPEASRHAEVDLALELRADQARSVALRLRGDLREQTLAPSWSGPQELIQLDVRAAFDERAGRTSITCTDLAVLGGMLAANAGIDVFDREPRRIDGSGKVKLAMDRLPLPVEGLSLEALALALEAKGLSWQGDRVAGAIEWSGGLRTLALAHSGQRVTLTDARLSGMGAFDAPSGHFQADTRVASLALQGPAATASITDAALRLRGKTRVEAGGTQQVEATASLVIPALRAQTATRQRLELGSLGLDVTVGGPLGELRQGRVASLSAKLDMPQVDANDGARRALFERAHLEATGAALVPDAASASGFQGAVQLRVALPALRVVSANSTPGAAATVARDLALDLDAPLSLASATGKLALGSASASDVAAQALALAFVLDQPTHFSPNGSGPASLKLTGSLGALRAGDVRTKVDAIELSAQRLDAARYRLALEGALSSLVLAGGAVPERVTASLQADADRDAGSFGLSGALQGPRGAEVALKLDATLARATQRLRYEAGLSAAKLDAFRSLIHGAVPSAQGVKIEGTRLRLTARGDLAGVARAAPGAWPEPTSDPLSSARGEQSLSLALEGLDHHAADSALVIPALTLDVDSKHGDKGAGSAHLRLKAGTLRYAGAGDSVHLSDLDEQLTASFARAPDRGLVDVRSTLTLGGATQSLFPAYRVADLRLRAHVQVDQLRSFFLRELSLENAAAGTTLQASGAIELRTVSTQGGTKTIVGREALALEGSLEQALAPFEQLGFAARASGTLRVPFRIESGGLLGYRLLAALQAKQVSLVTGDHLLNVDGLDGVIPIVEEFALLPGGVVVSAGPRASPLTETRFFDVHPFLGGNDYVTARSITLDGFSPLGPFAANVRVERSNFLIDQLQVGFRGGQIVGQARVAYRDGDPLVRLRLNATGVRSGENQDVLDANAALSFQPKVMTIDGKVQLVRASRSHVLGILDVIDPFHESASANRVRQGLKLGYPKFVRFRLHDGALDTKVDLGGVAQVVRIDEIKAVPLGPILQRYVVPALDPYLRPTEVQSPTPVAAVAEETP